MVDVVTPVNLNENQFDVGAPQVPNKISILPTALKAEGAGAPTVAPGPGDPPFYVDTSTTPHNLYHFTAGAWNLLGDGAGGGAATTVSGTAPIVVTGAPLTPNVAIDIPALAAALCADPVMAECIAQKIIASRNFDGTKLSVYQTTDGNGNFNAINCP